MVPRTRGRTALGAVLGLSLFASAACGTGHGDDRPGPDAGAGGAFLHSNVARASASSSVDYAAAAQGLRRLGYDLSTHLSADSGQGGNQVFSPASLAMAFAMLREGAGPASAAEIDKVIGLPTDRQAVYNALLQALARVGKGDKLEINDALFLDPRLDVKPAYLDAIQKWYGAGLHQTQFPEPALSDINGWVKARTHDRIPRLLDQLDPTAVFALVNTIYLDAKWATPFDPTDTTDSPFTTAAGSPVTVKMMHNQTRFDYARADGWQAVRLPYADGALSMWVLVPTGATDPRRLLTPEVLSSALSGAAAQTIGLSLPRWDTGTKADLTTLLGRLGLDKTYATGQFPGITVDPSFFVSEVVQQANITVGEKGTVAAAATAIVGETSGQLPPEIQVDADHPFAFAIVDDASGVPLFEGVVGDPSQQ
ncbi:MAG: serpin family protein [Nocardioidaceae bacterium]